MQNFSSDTKVTDATPQTASESQVRTSARKDKTSKSDMYTAREVAKILGVGETTIRKWRNERLFGCPILSEDLIDHHGVCYYFKDRIDALAKVFRKDWRTAWVHHDQPDFKNIAEQIKARTIITAYLQPAKHGGYCCIAPNCNNGRGKDATGANLYKNNTRLHCHVCGGDFSNIDVIAYHLGISTTGKDFIEILKHGCNFFGIPFDDGNNFSSTNFADSNEKELVLIQADISAAKNNLQNLPQFARRGLSFETLRRFNCGFIDNWTAPKSRIDNKKISTSRRLIIPTSERHYLASAIDRDSVDKKYWKMHAGNKEIFNLDSVSADSSFVIVVEGEIDAMSIWQATAAKFPVIAIGGAAGKNWIHLLNLKFSADDKKPPMLILFDDDDTGRKDAPILRDELLQHGYPSAFGFLPSDENGKKMDANDFLQFYGEQKLAEIILNASQTLQNRLQYHSQPSMVVLPIPYQNSPNFAVNSISSANTININFQNESDFFLRDFQENIERRKKFSGRKTGFDNIDNNQIFLPGVYILGGLPSIGKTTFAWQLLEQCADAGEHCLYISYEMSLIQLRSKSLARALWLREPTSTLTATQISMGGFNNSLAAIISQFQNSKRDFRAVKFTHERLSEVLPSLDAFCDSLDKPPIICIDYLQRIPFDSKERRDGISNNVRLLKDFQLKTDSTVIALSSLNRDNYSAPISFESFKETGEIEYSADVMWGLQLYCVNSSSGKIIDDRLRFEEAKKESPRKMQLKCVKNREGNIYDCCFYYFSAHEHFKPCNESDFKKICPPTNFAKSSNQRDV